MRGGKILEEGAGSPLSEISGSAPVWDALVCLLTREITSVRGLQLLLCTSITSDHMFYQNTSSIASPLSSLGL